jgi:hypothetical protein
MTQLLGTILEELGISQYLEAFLEQGFDSWETILDITESDLYVRDMSGETGGLESVLTELSSTAMLWG